MVNDSRNRVRYTLQSASQGTRVLEIDPNGWRDDVRNISKGIDKPGVIFDFINEVTFFGDGYDFIRATEFEEGFDAIITCKKEFRNQSDIWELEYQGVLDLSEKSSDFNSYSLKLEKGGVQLDLDASFNDSFELSRLDSIDGVTLPELTFRRGLLNGRELLVTSLLENKETDTKSQISGGQGGAFHVPSLNKIFSGDDDINGVFSFSQNFTTVFNDAVNPLLPASLAYVNRSQNNKTLTLNIKTKGSYSYQINTSGIDGTFQLGFMVTKFIDADNPSVFDRFIPLSSVNHPSLNSGISSFEFDYDDTIVQEVKEDESLFFGYRMTGAHPISGGTFTLTHENVSLESFENNLFRPTSYTGLTILDAAKRLSLITFGRDIVQSNELLNGDFKDLLITSGKNLRGFDDSIELSWKDLTESVKKVLNIDYGIEVIDGVEKIVFRKYNEFFRRRSLLDIGFIGNATETPIELNERVAVGYKDAGEYEERQGLDEHNTITNFKHNFRTIENELDLISDIRADNIAIELARRKQKEDFPTEDTEFDKDNFFVDCYSQQDIYVNRTWERDFEVIPTGVFSPETAFNLRLSPKNNLYRCSDRFTSLSQYQDRKTLFINAIGNSRLQTQLKDDSNGNPVAPRLERGDVLNSDLNRPLLQPYKVTFAYKFTEEELKFLMRSTDGIPNYYFSIGFTDRNDRLRYGYLNEYVPSDEGQLTLILANYGF